MKTSDGQNNDCLEVLRPDCIQPFLDRPIEVFWKETTSTTNSDAKQAARAGSGEAVFTAENQIAGRGRAGRNWVSGRGEAVEMSLLLRPDVPVADAAELSLAAGLGVADAIKEMTGLPAKVKWPNDVFVNGKKVCGILCETAAQNGLLAYAVLGIGVNVNQKSFDKSLSDTATSLRIETGREFDRARFAAALIDRVRQRVDQLAAEGLAALMPDYDKASSVLGKCVNVTTARGTITGICEGFGPHGELQVRTDDELLTFLANDVSVREKRDV